MHSRSIARWCLFQAYNSLATDLFEFSMNYFEFESHLFEDEDPPLRINPSVPTLPMAITAFARSTSLSDVLHRYRVSKA